MLVAVRALEGPDRVVLDLVQSAQARWVDVAASLVTILGQSEVLAAIALGVAVARLRRHRRDWWLPLVVVAVVGIELVCKFVIPQPPPPDELSRSVELVPFLHAFTPYAFPSGHVARLAFLATVLRWPWYLGGTLVLLMVLTRVYLAEHWPSDVLGGWLLGYAVALFARRS